MKKLDGLELENLNKKINILEELINVFNLNDDDYYYINNIHAKFSFDEVLSETFLNKCNNKNVFTKLFIERIEDHYFKYFLKDNINKEYFMDSIDFLLQNNKNKLNSYKLNSLCDNFNFRMSIKDYSAINYNCFKRAINIINCIKGDNEIKKEIIDSALIGNPDVLTIIDEIKEETKSVPLVLFNNNLSDETKIKIIKKAYRKKDLPLYYKIINSNLTSLDQLALFIDTVVINNNRIYNKIGNIIEILFKCYISNYNGNIKHKRGISEILTNSKSFLDNYLHYFKDVNFLDSFYMHSEESYSTRIFMDAILEHLSDKDFLKTILESSKEKNVIINNGPYKDAGCDKFTNILENYETLDSEAFTMLTEIMKKRKNFIVHCLTYTRNDKNDFYFGYKIILNNLNLFKETLNSLNFDYIIESYTSSWRFRNCMSDVTKRILSINKKILKELNIITSEAGKNLMTNYSSVGGVESNLRTYSLFLQSFKTYLINTDDVQFKEEMAKKLFNNCIKPFYDNTIFDLFAYNHQEYFSALNDLLYDMISMNDCLNNILHYKEYSTIKENIEQLILDVKLLGRLT